MGIFQMLRNLVIAGDLIYILWILYNGMAEGWRQIASFQAVVLLGLIILLAFNIFLLLRKR